MRRVSQHGSKGTHWPLLVLNYPKQIFNNPLELTAALAFIDAHLRQLAAALALIYVIILVEMSFPAPASALLIIAIAGFDRDITAQAAAAVKGGRNRQFEVK